MILDLKLVVLLERALFEDRGKMGGFLIKKWKTYVNR